MSPTNTTKAARRLGAWPRMGSHCAGITFGDEGRGPTHRAGLRRMNDTNTTGDCPLLTNIWPPRRHTESARGLQRDDSLTRKRATEAKRGRQ